MSRKMLAAIGTGLRVLPLLREAVEVEDREAAEDHQHATQ